MTTLRQAAQDALDAMRSFESGTNGLYEGEFAEEIAALEAALAEPEIEHKHEWFRTGAMEPGQIRCIHCGLWGELK